MANLQEMRASLSKALLKSKDEDRERVVDQLRTVDEAIASARKSGGVARLSKKMMKAMRSSKKSAPSLEHEEEKSSKKQLKAARSSKVGAPNLEHKEEESSKGTGKSPTKTSKAKSQKKAKKERAREPKPSKAPSGERPAVDSLQGGFSALRRVQALADSRDTNGKMLKRFAPLGAAAVRATRFQDSDTDIVEVFILNTWHSQIQAESLLAELKVSEERRRFGERVLKVARVSDSTNLALKGLRTGQVHNLDRKAKLSFLGKIGPEAKRALLGNSKDLREYLRKGLQKPVPSSGKGYPTPNQGNG